MAWWVNPNNRIFKNQSSNFEIFEWAVQRVIVFILPITKGRIPVTWCGYRVIDFICLFNNMLDFQ